MKKVRFWVSNGYHLDREKIVEYDYYVTEEDIEDDYESWFNNVIEGGWEFIDDEE